MPLTHAGGIVFRGVGDEVEFLIVQARNTPDQWVFPKGHIEPGETATEAALREVREEAGVAAEIVGEAGNLEFRLENESVCTQYFLMRYVAETEPVEQRSKRWSGYKAAMELLTFADSRALLSQAEGIRRRSEVPDKRGKT